MKSLSNITVEKIITAQENVSTPKISLDTSYQGALEYGQMAWDNIQRTLNIGLGNGVIGQSFQELHYPLVLNNTLTAIPNGTAVGACGYDANSSKVTICPFIADGSMNKNLFLGITTEDIAPGASGYVTFFGRVNDINTSTFNSNDELYVSDTEAGKLVHTPPLSPSFKIEVGRVITSNATTGKISVRIDIMPDASEVTYDNSYSGLVATNVAGVIDELNLKKADVSLLSSNIILYATKVNADVTGYYKLVNSINDPDYNISGTTISSGSLLGGEQAVATLIAPPHLFEGNPGVINITTMAEIAKTAGNNNAYGEFTFRLYQRTQEGTETLIATSGSTGVINPIALNTYSLYSSSAVLNNGTWLPTDRVVIRWFANLVAGVNPAYSLKVGGENPARTLIPVPVSVIPSDLAEDTLVDTSNFAGILNSTDTTVQRALDKIDDHLHDNRYTKTSDLLSAGTSNTTSGASKIGVYDASFTGILQPAIDVSVQTALEKLSIRAVDKNIFNASGDLLYASADNTPAILPKGIDGQILRLVSGVPTWGIDNTTYSVGNGLTSSSTVFSLGTPTGLTAGTSNALTTNSHTHSIATGTASGLSADSTNTAGASTNLARADHTHSITGFALTVHNHDTLYQPLDGDLTSIAGLTGATGLLRKTALDTWSLDTTDYVKSTGHTLTGTLTTRALVPSANNAYDIGTSSVKYRNGYFQGTLAIDGGATIGGTLTVNNLTINGDTTTVNSTTVTIDDPIFTLGGDTAPTVDDNKDRGIEYRWHNGTTSKLGFFGFDDSTGYFTFIPDADNDKEVFSGSKGTISANLLGNVTGNASTATTLAAARTISLTGAVTGSVSFNGSSDVSISTTHTADPTITLTGDVSGSGTMTNLGSVSITATVADDSHNHVISNVDGLQTALDGKQPTGSYLTTATTFGGDVSGTYNSIVVANDSHTHTASTLPSTMPPSSHAITAHTSGTWKTFYSNATSIVELALGAAGTYLRSTGASSAPSFSTIKAGDVPTLNQSTTGNAGTATKLATTRNIALTGSVTGNVNFDGSGNVSIATTTNHAHGTYDRATSALTGANVFSDIVVSDGIVSSISSRTLTLANLGYTGAVDANKYTHPAYTTKSSGLYKITVDATGHVSAATAVAKADITALGIPASDTITNISISHNATTVSVNSSDGTDGTINGANATTAGVVTNGAQTWAGVKTFNSAPVSANGYTTGSATMVYNSTSKTIDFVFV